MVTTNKDREDPEHTRKRAVHLYTVAAATRKTAAEMDQMAARMLRRIRPEGEPIPCCEKGPCLVCGVDSPPGHVHVDSPGSREAQAIVVGRVCSSHTLWEVIKTGQFIVSIEGDLEP